MEQEATGRGTALPRGAEGTPEDAGKCEIEIGVLEDDHGVLAAHLERETLVPAPAAFANLCPRHGRAGERHQRHQGMIHQRLPGHFATAMDQIDHAGREPGLQRQLHQPMRGMGDILGRLEDHGVPAHQRRKHLPGRDRHREN